MRAKKKKLHLHISINFACKRKNNRKSLRYFLILFCFDTIEGERKLIVIAVCSHSHINKQSTTHIHHNNNNNEKLFPLYATFFLYFIIYLFQEHSLIVLQST